MNQFDFYQITARTTRKTDLTKAGIPADKITSNTTFERYGHKSYPRRHYTATLDYVDLHNSTATAASAKVDGLIANWQKRLPGATIHARYHARD